jgi:two-component system NarL family sensor kinase
MVPDAPAPEHGQADHERRARRAHARRRQIALRGELGAFLAVSLIALLGVAAATIVLSGRIARENQLADAGAAATRITERLVAPLAADLPASSDALDALLDSRLQDGSVTGFFVWSSDGRILYATDHSLEGQQPPVTPELSRALHGEVVSDIDNHPEVPVGDPEAQPLLEVYVPMTVNGENQAFETYFTSTDVDRAAALLRGRIVPLAVGALAVLELVQIPLVLSLTRRLSRREAEHTQLVESNLIASDRERREIAADVHDGPVQELAGVSYALSALRPSVPEGQQVTVDRVVGAVRSAVASLRRLMVQIYPPDLSGPGLGAALEDLAGPLREQGLTVHVHEGNKPGLSPSAAAVLYRTAREALINVTRHANAETVWIRLDETRFDGLPAVRLTVADDGVGLPATPDHATGNGAPVRRPDSLPTPSGESAGEPGHLGLRLVRDRIVEAGGAVTVAPREGGGVVLDAIVPAQHGD